MPSVTNYNNPDTLPIVKYCGFLQSVVSSHKQSNNTTVTTQFIILSCIFFKGGVHTFVVSDSTEEPKLLDFLLTKENSVHMLWLIPQFFVITVGEILFSITALEFSYSQV